MRSESESPHSANPAAPAACLENTLDALTETGQVTSPLPDAVLGPSVAQPRISHALLLTSSQIVRLGSRTFFGLMAARALGPQNFGTYALIAATIEMVAVAGGAGYSDLLTRESAKNERLGWGIGRQLTTLRLILSLVFTGIALLLLGLLGYSPGILSLTALLSLSLVPRSLTDNVQGVLRGISRYSEFFGIDLVFSIGFVLGATVLLFKGGGLHLVIYVEVFASIAAAILALLLVARLRTAMLHLDLRELIETGAIFNFYAWVTTLYDRLDVLLLSRLSGDFATGIYSVAYRPMGVLQLVPYGLFYSLLPSLSRRDNAACKEYLEKAMGLVLNMAFVIVLLTTAFAGPLVSLILGGSFAAAAHALQILIWAVIFRYLSFALNIGLLAAHQERIFIRTSLICLAVNVAGNLILIPRFSWHAAAVITVLTELALLIQNVYWLTRTFGSTVEPRGWLRATAIFLACVVTILAFRSAVSQMIVGTVCALLFLAYIYASGQLRDFLAIYEPAVQPNSKWM
jgi:O-antigen/teichoic acid export membrane protein